MYPLGVDKLCIIGWVSIGFSGVWYCSVYLVILATLCHWFTLFYWFAWADLTDSVILGKGISYTKKPPQSKLVHLGWHTQTSTSGLVYPDWCIQVASVQLIQGSIVQVLQFGLRDCLPAIWVADVCLVYYSGHHRQQNKSVGCKITWVWWLLGIVCIIV